METISNGLSPVQLRTNRIKERLVRIDACLTRDKGNKGAVSELAEEQEALEMELKFMAYKAKKQAQA